MKWRVMLELVGPDGIVGVHEVGGRASVAEYAPRLIGLTLEEGKDLLAALQVAAGDDVTIAARSDPSKISAPDDWCRCSARWRSARHALPRAGVR
jgi:hypothetical protein